MRSKNGTKIMSGSSVLCAVCVWIDFVYKLRDSCSVHATVVNQSQFTFRHFSLGIRIDGLTAYGEANSEGPNQKIYFEEIDENAQINPSRLN